MHRLWNAFRDHSELQPLLQGCLEERIHHAYVLTGAAGMGKRAILLGLAVLLLQHEYPALTMAEGMERIMAGGFPDVRCYWDEGEGLKVETIRAINGEVATTTVGRRRIVLIEHIDRMTVEAANGFLKTLEEPGAHTIFLMSANQGEALLSTITSRVQLLPLVPLTKEEMAAYVAKVAPDAPSDVLALTTGRPGLVLPLLGDEEMLARYRRVYGYVESIAGSSGLEVMVPMVEELSGSKEDILLFLELYEYYVRERMIAQVASGQTLPEKWVNQLDELGTVRKQVMGNVHKRSVLEHFLYFT